MNYLRSYKQYRVFEDQDKIIDYDKNDKDSVKQASDSLNNLIQQLNDFKTKRNALERLIMDNRGEKAKDISKNIDDIVNDRKMGKNPFLSMYVSILDKEKRIADLEDKIDYSQQLEKERRGDLESSKGLSDISDREDQKNKLNQQIEDIKSNVRDMQDKIKDLEDEIKKDKSDLDKHMKELKRDFERDSKESQRRMR